MASSKGGPVVGVCHRRGPNENLPAQWLIFFPVPDLAATLERTTAESGDVLHGPREVEGQPYAVIRDPGRAVCARIAERGPHIRLVEAGIVPHAPKMSATVFTIANQKGGVGKTTTAIHLAAALAEKKVPTLLVDLDPQANATSGLGVEKEEGVSLYGPLLGEGSAADQIRKTKFKRLSIIPSEVDLAAIEVELAQRKNYLLQLREVLAPVVEGNDFRAIVLDCPPSLGMLSMNALAAADHLLITMQCEYLALEGLGQILKVVDNLSEAGVNPDLDVGGIIMTMYDLRTNLCRQVVEEVKGHFPEKVFEAIIPRTIRLGEAPSFGQTIFEYDNLNPAATIYRRLAGEVIQRFGLKG